MILLHAYPLDGSMWEGMDGMPVDHPGSGSLADWADLAASAMREPQAVCGLSMGGYAAFELVRRHPHLVSRLMLADTRAEPDSEEAAHRRAHHHRLRQRGRHHAARRGAVDG
jgi:pimeloyl-ACP methyl ester carboxylesterase